eukprot:2548552-Pleurochrysis_carterae.AAC.1
MANKGFPMSPRWLEQMGEEFALKAVRARRLQEAHLAQRPRATSSAAGSSECGDVEEEAFAPPQME